MPRFRSRKPEGDSGGDPSGGRYQGLIGQATSRSPIAPDGPIEQQPDPHRRRAREPLAKSLFTFRYLVPGACVAFGVVYAIVDWPNGAEAFSLFAGAGLSILLLNVLYRMGVEGDHDRDDEEAARDYFSEHGVWPDEPAKRPPRGPH